MATVRGNSTFFMRGRLLVHEQAATLTRLIDRVGTLEVGKVADLVVVEGNPVDDITRLQHGIRMVVQAGVVRRDDLGLATEG